MASVVFFKKKQKNFLQKLWCFCSWACDVSIKSFLQLISVDRWSSLVESILKLRVVVVEQWSIQPMMDFCDGLPVATKRKGGSNERCCMVSGFLISCVFRSVGVLQALLVPSLCHVETYIHIYIYTYMHPGSQSPLKKWWFLLDDEKTLLAKW